MTRPVPIPTSLCTHPATFWRCQAHFPLQFSNSSQLPRTLHPARTQTHRRSTSRLDGSAIDSEARTGGPARPTARCQAQKPNRLLSSLAPARHVYKVILEGETGKKHAPPRISDIPFGRAFNRCAGCVGMSHHNARFIFNGEEILACDTCDTVRSAVAPSLGSVLPRLFSLFIYLAWGFRWRRILVLYRPQHGAQEKAHDEAVQEMAEAPGLLETWQGAAGDDKQGVEWSGSGGGGVGSVEGASSVEGAGSVEDSGLKPRPTLWSRSS